MSLDTGTPQRAFSAGEQTPLLGARADLARWQGALEICENCVTLVQGGLTRRSGFADVWPAQDNSRMIEFAFSGADGYAIEFAPAPGKIRFYRDFGILVSAPLTPYEIACPFTAGEIGVLDTAQTADRMFIASGTKPIQQMLRLATLNWTIGAAPIKNGPFLNPNLDETFSLSCGGAGEIPKGTAGLTVTASAALFDPLHVGALFRVRVKDLAKHGKWRNAGGFAIGDIVEWDGNWYKNTGQVGGASGADPPVHLFGEAWDGDTLTGGTSAFKWLYLHSGFGVIQITGYTSATVATAAALTYVPDDLRTGTWRWAEGAWSDYRGYPSLIGFHKKRLYAARTRSQPTRVWGGVIDDYPNFDDSTTLDDRAFSFDLEADSGEVNFPQWLVSGKRLAIGTSHNEFVVGSADVTSPITPTSVDPESDTNEGSSAVLGIKVDNPVFVSKDGKRVIELGYDIQTQGFVTTDLTIEAEHITGAGSVGVTKLIWLREPYRLLTALRSDGVLLTACYRRDQNVIGWHRHPMAGTVLDICRAPSPSGIRQDLWAKIRYVLPSGTVTRVQSLMPFFERGDLTSESAFFVDCGIPYNGAPTTTVTTPAYLIGATVRVRADGQDRAPVVVTDGGGHGVVTLDSAASIIVIGLAFTARLRTLRYDQRLQGRNAKVSGVTLDVIRSGPVYARANDEAFDLLKGMGTADVDAPGPLTTGLLEVPLLSNWSDDGTVEVAVDHTGPLTVRALTPHREVAG